MKYLLALLLIGLAALEFFYQLSAAPAPGVSAPADPQARRAGELQQHLHGHH